MKMNYEAELGIIEAHQPAKWFKDSKFGIFVHWAYIQSPHGRPLQNVTLTSIQSCMEPIHMRKFIFTACDSGTARFEASCRNLRK